MMPDRKEWFNMVTIPKGILVLTLCLTVVGSAIIGFVCGMDYQEKKGATAVSKEVKELSHINLGFLKANPTDIAIWAGLLSEAKLCEECSALKEHVEVGFPAFSSRPLTLRIRGEDVGNSSSVGFTMVFGTLSAGEGGYRELAPRIVYYVGHQSGAVARIDESGNVEHRVGNEWRPKNGGSPLIEQARNAFRQKWADRLVTVH